jgi:hypothetical protein
MRGPCDFTIAAQFIVRLPRDVEDSATIPARYITELLGHSQVSFTMQTYAHALPEVQKQVAAKMDEILTPKPVATRVATKQAVSVLS